jgi:hypothetical protein
MVVPYTGSDNAFKHQEHQAIRHGGGLPPSLAPSLTCVVSHTCIWVGEGCQDRWDDLPQVSLTRLIQGNC